MHLHDFHTELHCKMLTGTQGLKKPYLANINTRTISGFVKTNETKATVVYIYHLQVLLELKKWN